MADQRALQLTDIPWLRLASRVAGTLDMPQPIAAKLLAGGYVEHHATRHALFITPRGKIALTRLG